MRGRSTSLKKSFLHGFRGTARRKKLQVFFWSFLIAIAYVQIGELGPSVSMAKRVPLAWKVVTFLLFFSSLWYSDWRIHRRVFDHSLPRLHWGWYACLGISAFVFAIISADRRALFYSCTFLSIVFLWASERYYRRRVGLKEDRCSDCFPPPPMPTG